MKKYSIMGEALIDQALITHCTGSPIFQYTKAIENIRQFYKAKIPDSSVTIRFELFAITNLVNTFLKRFKTCKIWDLAELKKFVDESDVELAWNASNESTTWIITKW